MFKWYKECFDPDPENQIQKKKGVELFKSKEARVILVPK